MRSVATVHEAPITLCRRDGRPRGAPTTMSNLDDGAARRPGPDASGSPRSGHAARSRGSRGDVTRQAHDPAAVAKSRAAARPRRGSGRARSSAGPAPLTSARNAPARRRRSGQARGRPRPRRDRCVAATSDPRPVGRPATASSNARRRSSKPAAPPSSSNRAYTSARGALAGAPLDRHDRPVVLWQLQRRELLASTLGELRSRLQEERDVGAERCRERVQPLGAKRSREHAVGEDERRGGVRAASAQAGGDAGSASRSARASGARRRPPRPGARARSRTSVSPVEAFDLQGRRTLGARAGRRYRCAGGRSRRRGSRRSVSVPRRAPDSAWPRPAAALVNAEPPARRTNSSGASASARALAGRPSAPSAATACARLATPASSSEFASVLRRWANAACTTRLRPLYSAPQSVRRSSASSAESTPGGGRKQVRATGWKPTRAQVSCTSTDTAPYARVPGSATKRSATSRWSITHQRATARKPVEALHADGRRDAVRQVGDQLGRRRVEPGEVERHAHRRRGAGCSRSPGASRVAAPRAGGRSRPRGPSGRARRGSGSARRGPPRSRARRRRARAPRDVRSRRGCSRRRGSAGRARGCGVTRAGLTAARTRTLRSPRSGARARPRSSPRAPASWSSTCMTYAGSLRRPRTGWGARYGAVGLGEQPIGSVRGPPRPEGPRAFGYVTFPANDTYQPRSRAGREQARRRRSSAGSTATSAGTVSRTASVSVLGRPRMDDEGACPSSAARAACARKSVSWRSRGA